MIGHASDNVELTFVLSVNECYLMFVLPFIWFSGIYHPNATYDIYVLGSCSILNKNNLIKGCQEIVNSKHNNICISLTFISHPNCHPMYYRFLADGYVRFKPKYCYIGDVDVMICENILPFHVGRIENSPYIYCNEVRGYNGGYSRMSGLMFVLAKEYYQKTKDIRLKYLSGYSKNGDELMLYDIVKESNLEIRPSVTNSSDFMKLRPAHGVHMSLNRYPFKNTTTVCDVVNSSYGHIFKTIVGTSDFLKLMKIYDREFLIVLDKFLACEKPSK